MKSKQQLKDELHKMIDSIDDEHSLNLLNEEIVPYLIENRDKEGYSSEALSDEEEQELNEAIRQADAGEVISWDDLLKKTERWHTK